jgi:hypothetical protein
MFNGKRSCWKTHCCLKTIISSNLHDIKAAVFFLIDLAPLWRHTLGMLAEVQKDESLSRQNLRLKNSIWKAIDDSCAVRAGAVSRNTWITEAIVEKLNKDADKATGFPKRGVNHA